MRKQFFSQLRSVNIDDQSEEDEIEMDTNEVEQMRLENFMMKLSDDKVLIYAWRLFIWANFRKVSPPLGQDLDFNMPR